MCNFLQYVYVAPINKAQVTNWFKNSIIPLEYISIVYPCTLQSPSVTSSGLVSLEAKLVHASHCLDCTLYGCGLLQILSCSMPSPPIFPPSLLYMFILVLSVCCFRAIGFAACAEPTGVALWSCVFMVNLSNNMFTSWKVFFFLDHGKDPMIILHCCLLWTCRPFSAAGPNLVFEFSSECTKLSIYPCLVSQVVGTVKDLYCV